MVEAIETFHWGAIFQIVLIDILLGGDNAVVIALACRNLPHRQRIKGILWGTAGAVLLRVLLIAFALVLLDIPFLKALGCLLLVWIGVKLLAPHEDAHGNITGGTSVLAAIRTIILADFAMSLDNVIAIAGAAQNAQADHQLYYVIFGLCVSVPIIVWGSTLVLKLIDRFPLVVTLGAGLLGWIAGGMLITDIYVVERWGEPAPMLKLAVEAAGALVVVAAGKWLAARRRHARPTHDESASTTPGG
ncbi:TerC family protein [Bordetella pertussis]|uniref:Membrane protein n=7 Tax=Bordetella TaxID=517 RepID=Q7VXT7_BORPE|nr:MULTISPECIES: TerC family protein [Bordetella]ETH38578.1 integral membrane protein, YjbE family [Bordetella pertussis H918]ETH47620.1 integral membrane protein, YjbE family [Bordetella pertussis H921]ETH69811.1 integral membrane protein, YjbE family [Bordetella pertussis STO1-CHLA-0011]ETH89526.1 integral membrane protein, YjbE family [Bordetella pertussis STO1-CHOC-0019]ETH99353.1 integral membrane protein, YjbE family [Bordetella pertussis STO1-CHOM-0012]KCV23417.1 integral membrane prot